MDRSWILRREMNAAHVLLADAHLDDGRLIRGELEQLRGEPFTVEVVHAVADALVRLLGYDSEDELLELDLGRGRWRHPGTFATRN